MLILLAESDPDVSLALCECIEALGFSYLCSYSFESTKKILASHNPDIVILSKHLKGGGVQSLAHEAMSKKLKTIIISTDKLAGIDCSQFIRQPFGLDDLEKVILH